jgi:ATP-dependent Lon protease
MNESFEFDPLSFSNIIDDSTEFIPLLSKEDEENMNDEKIPEILSILPLRNTVLFPGVVIPITVGRDKSIKLIKDAYKGDKIIGVVAQKDDNIEDPEYDDLNKVGTVARIIKLLKMPDGSSTVIIQGKKRFRLEEMLQAEPYIKAKVVSFDEKSVNLKSKEFLALVDSLKDLAIRIIQQSPNIPSDAAFALKNIDSPSFLINFISSNMNADVNEKQKMLEEVNISKRATLLLTNLTKELQMLELKNQIQSKVKVDIDKQQREYFLNQQMKTIQEELGSGGVEKEIEKYKERAKQKKWSKDAEKAFNKEMEKLQRTHPNSPDHGIQINYIETFLDLPWEKYTKDKFDLKRAKKILDRDHFGLEKIKDRILEHLAVLKLKGDMKSPIICLVGPPGVGKTSLGKSVAEALGRKYIRMSLGGLRDEAEIRGHRKTYIGAMPGRIIQYIKKAEYSNPVFVLDEIDKLGRDYHGDPSSALLEVLDPEQNTSFYDNFLEVEYDLSRVMFIATANSLNTIQPALLDRMEIIQLSGYALEEKLEIAKKYLIPKQLKENGVKKEQVIIPKEVLVKVIEEYTSESGVRQLEKRIAKITRTRAKLIAMEEEFEPNVNVDELFNMLGPAHTKEKYQGNDVTGIVTGLAWTSVGGDILFIEASLSKGKGKLTLTGNLGDVMKESAVIANEYIKSHASELGISDDFFDNWNIHVHVPEGATPKDGPSAGITILTALTSAFLKKKVRANLAMTGEITLRGKVLPVGGIKEKILAAKRAGIKEIILCEANQKDINYIEQDYLKGLKFIYVKNMMEVLDYAILK